MRLKLTGKLSPLLTTVCEKALWTYMRTDRETSWTSDTKNLHSCRSVVLRIKKAILLYESKYRPHEYFAQPTTASPRT